MAASTTSSSHTPVFFCFEFEHGIFNGRRLMFEAAKKARHEKDIALTPVLFSRFCLNPLPHAFVPALLEHFQKKLSAEKIARDIDEEYRSLMAGKKAVANERLTHFISQAVKAHHRAAAFTLLEEKNARTLADRAGLEIALLPSKLIGAPVPSADTWMRLVKFTNADPKQCIPFVTSGLSCRSAVVAGLHSVAMPDEFTDFQDYAGADISPESDEALSLHGLLEIMQPLSSGQAAS